MANYLISRKEAIKRLTNRYAEQKELTPNMTVSLELYIKRNVRHVRVFGSLEEYSQR